MKKILLSPIGTRGDVQPMLALAIELRSLGHEAVFCTPPNYVPWVESHGFEAVPVGQDIQVVLNAISEQGEASWSAKGKIVRTFWDHTRAELKAQFRVLPEVAARCRMIIGSAMHLAGSSVAEKLRIPYTYIASCPIMLPSAAYPPASVRSQTLQPWVNTLLRRMGDWAIDRALLSTFNEQRIALGVPAVTSIAGSQLTNSPWLAADPLLAPVPPIKKLRVTQTASWRLVDSTPLPDRLQRFLADGAPPIYFGFGSMPSRATDEAQRLLVAAARAAGRRAIISTQQPQADPIDAGADCLTIGAVSHEELFPRVAAVVHHGGAGTTTTAVRAGVPQVIIASFFDQPYWAHRVRQLGVGVARYNTARLTAPQLISGLHECLRPEVSQAARELAGKLQTNGARTAAQGLVKEFSLSAA